MVYSLNLVTGMAGGRDCSQGPHLLEGEARLLVLPEGLPGAAPLRPRHTSAMTRVSASPPHLLCGRGAFSVYTQAALRCTRGGAHTPVKICCGGHGRPFAWPCPGSCPGPAARTWRGRGSMVTALHTCTPSTCRTCAVLDGPPPSRRGSAPVEPGRAWCVHARCIPSPQRRPRAPCVVSPA